jgi:uncharacterized GH25 family protein
VVSGTDKLQSSFLESLRQQDKEKVKEEPKRDIKKDNEEHLRGEQLRGEKTSLNRAEQRAEDLSKEYSERVERRDTLQINAGTKTKNSSESASPLAAVSSETVQLSGREIFSVDDKNSSRTTPSFNAAGQVQALQPTLQETTEISAKTFIGVSGGTGNVIFSQGQPQVFTATPQPLDSAAVLTIFNATGQLGKSKDEKKDDEEKTKEGKKKEKKGTFASLLQTFIQDGKGGIPKKQSVQSTADKPSETMISAAETNENQEQQTEDKKGKHGEAKKDIPFAEMLEVLKEPIPFEGQRAAEPTEDNAAILQEMIQRVAAACQSTANQGGTVRMKLYLGEQLGSVSIKTATKDKKWSIRFETETDQAMQLLTEHLDELKSLLAAKNITLENIEVEFGS